MPFCGPRMKMPVAKAIGCGRRRGDDRDAAAEVLRKSGLRVEEMVIADAVGKK